MELIYLAVFIILVTVAIGLVLTHLKAKDEGPLPYQAKKYFFSHSEQEFLRILNESIDRQRYLIFPKVRLADFIEVTVKGKEYQGWWNKIRSKHVDFLIWDVQQNKIALAIELDGRSHGSEKMQERDEFVNRLYEQIHMKLERVSVGTEFSKIASEIHASLNTLK